MTAPTPLTVRRPEDVLALVPFVLGFLPEDSLVLMTTGGRGTPFHARIDLPDDPADLDLVVTTLVEAALHNEARHGILVHYTHDGRLAEEADTRMRDGLAGIGVDVVVSLRADAGHYHWIDDPDRTLVPYDVEAHPIAALAVYEGRVTYRNRQELSDSLVTTDPEAVEVLADLCARATRRIEDQARHPLGPEAPGRLRSYLVEEAVWGRDRVRRAVADGERLDDAEAARLLAALMSDEVRDVVWVEIQRVGARNHVGFWTDLVRRAPAEVLAPPAALLAFSAWMSGDGALAWCAVDRSREADPGYSMTALVATVLQSAMPPTSWKPVDPASLTLFRGQPALAAGSSPGL